MEDYKPIDCDYYDRLEAWATMKTVCTIVLKQEDGQIQELSARIEDVYTKDKIEYLKTDTGQVFRLDALVSVNGIAVP